MNKLSRIKKWLTLAETAKCLADMLNEPVTEADVLRLAMDRSLRLSVFFTNVVPARSSILARLDDAQSRPEFHDANRTSYFLDPDELLGDAADIALMSEHVSNIDGLWDFPFVLGQGREIRKKYNSLSNDKTVIGSKDNCVFLYGADKGGLYQLLEPDTENGTDATRLYMPTTKLPEDSIFVVRPQSLHAFLSQVENQLANGAIGKDGVLASAKSISEHPSVVDNGGGECGIPRIRSSSFEKLKRAIQEYPARYNGRCPKLDDDVRPWLKKEFNCSERESAVFGAILAEHFNLGSTSRRREGFT